MIHTGKRRLLGSKGGVVGNVPSADPDADGTSLTGFHVCAGTRGCFPAAVGPRPADGFGWDAHVADGCDFGCGSMTWPTP